MSKFYNILQNDNFVEIYLYGDVGEWSEVNMLEFKAKLSEIDNNAEMNIHISSYGGEVLEGLTIGSLIKQHKGKTIAYIDSWACSIASIIACSCDVVRMYNSSTMMIHNALCGVIGNAEQLRKQADTLDKISDSLKSVYLEKSNGKLDFEMITKLMNEETWLNAEECIEYGLCDEIIEVTKDMVAYFDKGILDKYKNVPDFIKNAIAEHDNKELLDKLNKEIDIALAMC